MDNRVGSTYAEMRPGFDMDRLIQTRVMGLDPALLPASYSHNLMWAMEIFDRFQIVCLVRDAKTTPSEPYEAQIFDGKQTHYARSLNPALALCRAALSAAEAGG